MKADPNKWRPVETAPYGSNLQVAVIEHGEPFALVFPCRREAVGWIEASNEKPLRIHPTHWREWREGSES